MEEQIAARKSKFILRYYRHRKELFVRQSGNLDSCENVTFYT